MHLGPMPRPSETKLYPPPHKCGTAYADPEKDGRLSSPILGGEFEVSETQALSRPFAFSGAAACDFRLAEGPSVDLSL